MTQASETHGTRQNSGLWTRVVLLVLNLLICVGVMATTAVGSSADFSQMSETMRLLLQVLPSILMLGPMFFAAILAAWGPWHFAIRAALLMILVTVMTAVQLSLEFYLQSYTLAHTAGLTAFFLYRMSNWLCALVAAALCLAMLGSLRRLRIGPPELPPIRVTILSIMLATLIVGLMIEGKFAIDTAYRSAIHLDGSPDQEASLRYGIILQIATSGLLGGMFAYCAAAAAVHWLARLTLVMSSLGMGTYSHVMNLSSGTPETMLTPLLIATVCGSGVLILAGTWIALCIHLLDRSGWPCSSRTLAPQTP